MTHAATKLINPIINGSCVLVVIVLLKIPQIPEDNSANAPAIKAAAVAENFGNKVGECTNKFEKITDAATNNRQIGITNTYRLNQKNDKSSINNKSTTANIKA